MKADYLSYQRATGRSLLGMAIQFALGVVFLLYSIFGQDEAAGTAAAFILIGVPAWLVLAVLFDQHRRERIEAIEAEAFASSDAAASSVFESQADDLRVAARRLKLMYRWLVPTASVVIGALLVGIGIWRFKMAEAQVGGVFKAPPLRGWAMAIGAASALIAFLYARYISVMSKQKVWANLRAGASFAAGAALFGLALCVAQFVDMAGQGAALKYLALGFAVVVIGLGCEVFLNFVMDIYRPRKPGEYPRPAFESRVLGLIAAPDRIAESIGEAINYQFGYDVSGSWFYRLLSRSVFRVLVPVGVIVMWLMSSMVVVRPHEQALVLRFGDFQRVAYPGLNFKWPWPVETIEIPEYIKRGPDGKIEFASRTVTGVRSLNIGSLPAAADKPVLWTNEHAAKEVFFLVQPAQTRSVSEAGGRDLSLMAVEVPLHYAIKRDGLEQYEKLAPPEMRDDLLKSVAQRELMQFVSGLSVDDLLSARREQLQGEIRQRINKAFDDMHSGVEVLFVGVDGLHPPQETAPSFEQVVGAEQKYHALLKTAEGDSIKTLTDAAGSVELADAIVKELDVLSAMDPTVDGKSNPALVEQRLKIRKLVEAAGGKAATLLLDASAERWQKHMGARAALSAYRGQLGAYRAAPGIYRAGLYLEALRSAMADARVFVTDSKNLKIRTNFEDRENVADIFRSQGEQNQ